MLYQLFMVKVITTRWLHGIKPKQARRLMRFVQAVKPESNMGRRAGNLCRLCLINRASSLHHLIPKSILMRRGGLPRFAPLCSLCHRFIHQQFSNRKLASELNTIETLRNHSIISSFISHRTTQLNNDPSLNSERIEQRDYIEEQDSLKK